MADGDNGAGRAYHPGAPNVTPVFVIHSTSVVGFLCVCYFPMLQFLYVIIFYYIIYFVYEDHLCFMFYVLVF